MKNLVAIRHYKIRTFLDTSMKLFYICQELCHDAFYVSYDYTFRIASFFFFFMKTRGRFFSYPNSEILYFEYERWWSNTLFFRRHSKFIPTFQTTFLTIKLSILSWISVGSPFLLYIHKQTTVKSQKVMDNWQRIIINQVIEGQASSL